MLELSWRTGKQRAGNALPILRKHSIFVCALSYSVYRPSLTATGKRTDKVPKIFLPLSRLNKFSSKVLKFHFLISLVFANKK